MRIQSATFDDTYTLKRRKQPLQTLPGLAIPITFSRAYRNHREIIIDSHILIDHCGAHYLQLIDSANQTLPRLFPVLPTVFCWESRPIPTQSRATWLGSRDCGTCFGQFN